VAGPNQTISGAGGIKSAEAFGAPTVWQTANLARLWFADARREAAIPDRDARRREVLFSVIAAETYLYEWVRDVVLDRDFQRIDQFFPPGNPSPILEKWKRVPEKLRSDGLVSGVPDLSGRTWARFDKLVKFRNGLLHGAASRPQTSGLPPENMPLPTMEELYALPAGWCVQVVSDLIAELSTATGIPQLRLAD